MQARFLNGDDKLLAIERLRMNQMGISSGVWRWDHVRECLLDVKVSTAISGLVERYLLIKIRFQIRLGSGFQCS